MKKMLWLLPVVILAALGLTGCTSNMQLEGELLSCQMDRDEYKQNLLDTQEELFACEKNSVVTELTGSVEDVEDVEDIDVPSIEEVVIESFGDQPKYAAGNYSGNSAQLNAYAHNNGVNFSTKVAPTKMIVTLKKPVESAGRNLILYVNPKGVSRYCGGRFVTNIDVGTQTFEFDLTNMNIQFSSCDGNRTEKFRDATEVRVGGYITEYNGNKLLNVKFE